MKPYQYETLLLVMFTLFVLMTLVQMWQVRQLVGDLEGVYSTLSTNQKMMQLHLQ